MPLMSWRRLRALGVPPALCVIALDLTSSACASDDGPEPSSGSSTEGPVRTSVEVASCEREGAVGISVAVKQSEDYVEYDCQLGMCSKGGCNEDNAYATHRGRRDLATSFRILDATCSPDCSVEPTSSFFQETGQLAVHRAGRGAGDVDIAFTLQLQREPWRQRPTFEAGPFVTPGASPVEIVYRRRVALTGRSCSPPPADAGADVEGAEGGAGDAAAE